MDELRMIAGRNPNPSPLRSKEGMGPAVPIHRFESVWSIGIEREPDQNCQVLDKIASKRYVLTARQNSTNKTALGFLSLIAYYVVSGVIYFVSAGRTDLPMAWAYFGINLGFGLAFSLLLARTNPELIAERMKPGPGEQDHVTKLVGLVLLLLQLILAGMDVGRFHWTAPVHLVARIAAFVLVVVGYGVAAWATYSNRFFSSAVRLQPDRRQVVIDGGPYALVRHPGYAGMLLYLPFSGVALGSWLAGVVAGVPMTWLLLRRTLLEDAMLQKGLSGYDAYAARVKYRLIPGVW